MITTSIDYDYPSYCMQTYTQSQSAYDIIILDSLLESTDKTCFENNDIYVKSTDNHGFNATGKISEVLDYSDTQSAIRLTDIYVPNTQIGSLTLYKTYSIDEETALTNNITFPLEISLDVSSNTGNFEKTTSETAGPVFVYMSQSSSETLTKIKCDFEYTIDIDTDYPNTYGVVYCGLERNSAGDDLIYTGFQFPLISGSYATSTTGYVTLPTGGCSSSYIYLYIRQSSIIYKKCSVSINARITDLVDIMGNSISNRYTIPFDINLNQTTLKFSIRPFDI